MVTPCCKWIFLIGMLVFTSFMPALDIVVLNDIPEMIRLKKISLRIDFSAGEKFLYRDMLRFSSSNPKIALRFWKASVAAKYEYITSFHQNKRVFIEPFDLELTFEGVGTDETTLPEELALTNVVISYVTLNNQLAHMAKTAIIPISRSEQNPSASEAIGLDNSLGLTTVRKNAGTKINILSLDEEISYLQQGEAFYQQLGDVANRINHALEWIFMLIILLLTCLLMTWRLLKQPNTLLAKYYPKQFAHITLSLIPIAFAYAIGSCGAHGVAHIVRGSYLLVLGCYLLITQHGLQKTFKNKSLSMLGGMCCISVFPLIIKGLLIILG